MERLEEFKNRTERLIFRALEPEDVDWLMELENDPSHWLVGERQLPLSRNTFLRYIENASEALEDTGQFRWVIAADSNPVGLIDLYNYSAVHQRASVGILVLRNHRNKGYAKESLRWLIRYSKDILQLHQLFAEIVATNEQSIHLFDSVGFERTGTLKDWLRRREGFEDVVQTQLLL